MDTSLAAELCLIIGKHCKANNVSTRMATLRSFVRLLNSAYLLRTQYTLDFASSLWNAFRATVISQLKETDKWGTALQQEVEKKLRPHLNAGADFASPNYISSMNTYVASYKVVHCCFLVLRGSGEHVLTPSRRHHAESVLVCVACNIPGLLEGPAAVGKTSLVSYLAKAQLTPKKLERVNNTATTSIQDYLGSYLPMGSGFVFQEGALYRAMKNGWWFLSDEFNLAEPAVLNLLFPLLEGKRYIQVPGTNKTVVAHRDFRFFATQNDAKYAYRHQLPDSLRNRFLEVQINDFPQDELPAIIEGRSESSKLNAIPGILKWFLQFFLTYYYRRTTRCSVP